jgi:Telomere resolvase
VVRAEHSLQFSEVCARLLFPRKAKGRLAYGAVCCHKFKPRNMTDDIFLAQILGHNLLGPNAALSVGQSYPGGAGDAKIRDFAN